MLAASVAGCLEGAETIAATVDVDPLEQLFRDYPAEVLRQSALDTTGAAAWVRETMSAMTLREMAAQLVIVDMASAGERVRTLVENHGVGGVLVPRVLPPGELRDRLGELQEDSTIPLLTAADYERGAGRFSNNLTELPSSMAVGATGDTTFAAAVARLTAIESRAIGVNTLFAPVADVNANPANPIINIRAFGDNPRQVARFSATYAAEAARWGAIATFKHFPGHGNTSEDTHAQLAAVPGIKSDLATTDLLPYAYAVSTNRTPAAVMTAHVWVPAYDSQPTPATISPDIVTGLLRDEIGFRGLVITDDLRMGALVTRLSVEDRVLRPIRAGADVLLTPEDPVAAIQILHRAATQDRALAERVRLSARRVLVAKASIGLHNLGGSAVSTNMYDVLMGAPHGRPIADAIARASVTHFRRAQDTEDFRSGDFDVVHISNFTRSQSITTAMDSVDAWFPGRESVRFNTELTDAEAMAGVSSLRSDRTVVFVYLRLASGRGDAGLLKGQQRVITRLLDGVLDGARKSARDVHVVLLGNPYAAANLGRARTVMLGYDQTLATARVAVEGLRGEVELRGVLPVTIPEVGDAW